MKKFILIFALLIGVSSSYNKAEAQNINISINIGRQPAWGPVGYDYAGYYYFPEINCYYDVNVGMFYYLNRGYWASARYLPFAYRNYDLYRLYKVVLNVHDPWHYNRTHYRDYGRYKGHNHRQVVIRDSRDNRYRDSRNNNVRWYSDRNSGRNNDHNYRPDNNRRPNNNNNNKQNNHATRPNNNSRSNNNDRDKNKGRETRPNTNNNSGRDNNNRQNMSNRDNNRQSSSRDTQRQNRESNKSTTKSSNFRYTSNDSGGRGR